MRLSTVIITAEPVLLSPLKCGFPCWFVFAQACNTLPILNLNNLFSHMCALRIAGGLKFKGYFFNISATCLCTALRKVEIAWEDFCFYPPPSEPSLSLWGQKITDRWVNTKYFRLLENFVCMCVCDCSLWAKLDARWGNRSYSSVCLHRNLDSFFNLFHICKE